MNYKLVALKKVNGSCTEILTCTNVDERQLNELINEVNKYEVSEQVKKEELERTIEELKEKVKSLEKQVKELKGEDYEEVE